MIFFDIDRTLFDYDHAVDRAMVDFYQEFRGDLDLDLGTFKQKWVELYEQYWPQYELGTLSLKEQRILRMQGLFAARNISTVQAEKYARFHNDAYVSHWRLFPDALPLLDHLKERKLGVISNGNVERQRAKLERSGILDRFEVVIISAAHGFAKPDPRIFMTACQLGNSFPAESTHIGDNLNADIAGAAGAGLSAVWIDRFATDTNARNARTITSLIELIGQLDQ
jgi:putative hydrolase of the HAD superfamily